MGPQQPITLYLIYARKDEAFKQEFEDYLTNLQHDQTIIGWFERQVQPGTDWSQTIDPRLQTTQLVLVLVSPALLASGYCSGAEFRAALGERRKTGAMIVIPILLHHVDLTGHPLDSIQPLPREARPVSSWRERNEAWADISRGIRSTIQQHQAGRSRNEPTEKRGKSMEKTQRLSQPFQILCIASPEDISLLIQWEKHLLPLQQNGHITCWSERHLKLGVPRQEQITSHMKLANLIIILLSPDFMASDECVKQMEQALKRQQEDQVTIVPLLLRPTSIQDSLIASLPCLPLNGRPVTAWPDRDAAFQECKNRIQSFLSDLSRA